MPIQVVYLPTYLNIMYCIKNYNPIVPIFSVDLLKIT